MNKRLVSASLACAVALGTSSPSTADEAIIKVRNLSPRFIAWWLDPVHQKMPYEVWATRASSEYGDLFNPGMPQSRMFTLPAGIQKLEPVDPQNSIAASGTPEALNELKDQIKALDRPLRQVEIESWWAEVDRDAIGKFGIVFKPAAFEVVPAAAAAEPAEKSAAPLPVMLGDVRTNFLTTLKELEAAKRARIVSAPRVVAIDWLPSTIHSETAIPLHLPATTDGLFRDIDLYTTTRNGFTALPMVQKDETIRLRFLPNLVRGVYVPRDPEKPFAVWTAEERDKEQPGDSQKPFGLRSTEERLQGQWLPFRTRQAVVTAEMQGGETKVLTGFMQDAKPLAKSSPAKDILVFVTARIVRRGEDAVPVKQVPQVP